MSKSDKVFFGLSFLFIASLLVSNIIAGKIVTLFGITFPSAVIIFPIVYIVGDILPECFGLKRSQFVIMAGFLANLYAVIFFTISLKMPFPSFWQNQTAYETVLGYTPRLLLASFAGYLIGTNSNAIVLILIKKLTGSKFLWVRTIGSTLVGETLDSMAFITIAFFGIMPLSVIFTMIFWQASFKIAYETLATPITYLAVNYTKKLIAA